MIEGGKQTLIRAARRAITLSQTAVSAPRVIWAGIDEPANDFAARVAKFRASHRGRILCPMPYGMICPDGCDPVPFAPKMFRLLHPKAPSRYRVGSGGRGSGKSHAFSARVILRMIESRCRVLCAREIQRSLRESVHQLLISKIDELGLGEYFTSTDREITCTLTGSEAIFAGLSANLNSLKSLEDISLCWIEEGESISERSLEILAPTIRGAGSEIWISCNPDDPSAPVQTFIDGKRPETMHVHSTFDDNPWFPASLKLEMEYLRRVDDDLFRHVWLGQCRTMSNAQVFRGKYVVEDFTPEKDWNGPYLGADWGFSQDPSTLIKAWVHSRTLYVEHEAFGVGVDIDRTPQLFDTVPDARSHTIRADSARPETISFVARNGYPNIVSVAKWSGSVEDGIAHIRSYERIVIHPRCAHVVDEFRLYSFKVDKLSGDVLPAPTDRHNHMIDALRYALEPLIRGAGQGILGWYASQNAANAAAVKVTDDGSQPLPQKKVLHFQNPSLRIEPIA